MLAAVGEEGRVARPQGRRGVIEGELSERYEVRPVIASITRKGAQDISNKIARRDLGGGGLEGGDKPDATGQEIDMHLQEVVAGASHRQVEEAEADAATPTRTGRDWEGGEKPESGGPL